MNVGKTKATVLRQLARCGWVATVAAPFVTHWSVATGRGRWLAAGFACIQLTMIASVARNQALVWRRTAVAVLLAVVCAGLAARILLPGMLGLPGLIAASALSHATLYLSLLAVFASTLQPGRTPLVTSLAQRLRGPLSPPIVHYTRQVTWLWCGYFAAQLVASAVLLAVAPVAVWSLFVNVLDAPLLVAVFAAEFTVRRIRFRHEQHISPVAIMRAFRQPPAGPAADAG